MIKEAETYREQDEIMRSKITARNELETYVYQIKNMVRFVSFFHKMKINEHFQLSEPALDGKIPANDRTTLISTCEAALEWLSKNPSASEQEINHKKQEIEHICKPIATRLYATISGGQFPSQARQFPGNTENQGPIIDEAD